jgi:hypothetical protein
MYAYNTPSLRLALDQYRLLLSQGHVQRNRATRGLVAALLQSNQRDISTARSSLSYDYFRRELEREIVARDQLMNRLVMAQQLF